MEQAASPYVNVRVGIPEHPGGNNHMRRQVKVSPGGVVHMVYRVYDAAASAADSNTNGTYFYNAYDCGGSNALLCPGPPAGTSKCYQMKATFFGIGDSRPRVMTLGGIMVPNAATGVPVVYGERFIELTNTPQAGDFLRRGWATMKDGAECLGLFSMDTSQTNTSARHPVMHALNESTWVATFRNGGSANTANWSYTTNRGVSWSALALLPSTNPWFNSFEITSSGNTFYIVSHADPADPGAFQTTSVRCICGGTTTRFPAPSPSAR